MNRSEFAPLREEPQSSLPHRVYLASPRGFCAGVERAIDGMWEWISRHPGESLYAYHKIVHNTGVVKRFIDAGVIFVNDLSEVPDNAAAMVSAHGATPKIFQEGRARGITMIDATCPLVTKVHKEAERFDKEGLPMAYIAHRGHDEAVGTMGHAPGSIKIIQTVEDAREMSFDGQQVALITQTTLSQDDSLEIQEVLGARFSLVTPKKSDICYATQDRQDAVKEMVMRVKEDGYTSVLVVVVGSPDSSNSNRLCEVAKSRLLEIGLSGLAIMVDDVTELKGRENEFRGIQAVALTSGASVPEETFSDVVSFFASPKHVSMAPEVQDVVENLQFAPIKF